MFKKVFMTILTLLSSFLFAQEKASLYGTVIDIESGECLEAVNIFFKDSKIGTMSNELGCYSILNIDPGTHELITSMMGYEHFTQSITLKPGERRNLNIFMNFINCSIYNICREIWDKFRILHNIQGKNFKFQ